ncbi:MAG: hypothetical protein M3R46_09370 [Actinomycetota bacterium]|nr:hypothetical protein [Actinomycetota bacterium]
MAHRCIETCTHTGVTIPECSCVACARALMARHNGQPDPDGEDGASESPAAALGSLWRAIVDPGSRRESSGASAVVAIRRAFPRHFAVG